MHDINGKALHPGDRVRVIETGKEFHIHNYSQAEHKGAKVVAFANEVELVEKRADNVNKPDLGGGTIIWGNGPQLPDDGTGGKK